MTRQSFMMQLRKKLKRLPPEEFEAAVSYYDEYFDEAGDDQKVIAELGSPSEVAAKIISEFAYESAGQRERRTGRVFFIVLLGIFAGPIALPVAITLFAVLLVIVITVFAVLISLGAAAAGLMVGGLAYAVASFAVIAREPMTTLFFLGFGLLSVGIGGALGIGTFWLSKHSVRGLTKLAAKLIRRDRRAES